MKCRSPQPGAAAHIESQQISGKSGPTTRFARWPWWLIAYLDVIYTFDGFVGGLPLQGGDHPAVREQGLRLGGGHGAGLRPGTAILDLAIGDDKGTAAAKVFNLGR